MYFTFNLSSVIHIGRLKGDKNPDWRIFYRNQSSCGLDCLKLFGNFKMYVSSEFGRKGILLEFLQNYKFVIRGNFRDPHRYQNVLNPYYILSKSIQCIHTTSLNSSN